LSDFAILCLFVSSKLLSISYIQHIFKRLSRKKDFIYYFLCKGSYLLPYPSHIFWMFISCLYLFFCPIELIESLWIS
jgi:hypothetical protein